MAWGTGTPTGWSAGRSQATSPVLEALEVPPPGLAARLLLRAAHSVHDGLVSAGTLAHAEISALTTCMPMHRLAYSHGWLGLVSDYGAYSPLFRQGIRSPISYTWLC